MKDQVLSTSVVLKGEKLACKKDPDPILVDSVLQTNTSIETVCVFMASTVHNLNVLFPRAHRP